MVTRSIEEIEHEIKAERALYMNLKLMGMASKSTYSKRVIELSKELDKAKKEKLQSKEYFSIIKQREQATIPQVDNDKLNEYRNCKRVELAKQVRAIFS